GHPDALGEMVQRVLQVVLDPVRRHLDVDARAILSEQRGGGLHGTPQASRWAAAPQGLRCLGQASRGRGGTADAPGLGPGGRRPVEVRGLSPASPPAALPATGGEARGAQAGGPVRSCTRRRVEMPPMSWSFVLRARTKKTRYLPRPSARPGSGCTVKVTVPS